MADFYELENLDGVRMTWNVWPNSKQESQKCVIPFAAIYSPNKPLSGAIVSPRSLTTRDLAGGSRSLSRIFQPPVDSFDIVMHKSDIS